MTNFGCEMIEFHTHYYFIDSILMIDIACPGLMKPTHSCLMSDGHLAKKMSSLIEKEQNMMSSPHKLHLAIC